METLDSIAEEIGYSRNELMQSMVKFGLTNRDWRNEGLTAHKRLPRYEENPMATKPPSAAQLAARARFAEMARSGSLNRKRQIAAKKNASVKKNPVGYKYRSYLDEYATKTDDELRYIIEDASGAALAMRGHSPASEEKYLDQVNDASTILYRRRHGLDEITAEPKAKRKRNPAKKTVSQKISQLVNEGYPQKQAVAVALNEQRAGKVKRNPVSKPKKQRMLNISWLTAGGQREVMSVPVEFTFTEYVGNVAEKFFARIENGFLVVSEYGTGGKIGTVPYSMRGAALNDREAAKLFTRKAIDATGPERFQAAIRKFSTIN
jgi:hypothetical protein